MSLNFLAVAVFLLPSALALFFVKEPRQKLGWMLVCFFLSYLGLVIMVLSRLSVKNKKALTENSIN